MWLVFWWKNYHPRETASQTIREEAAIIDDGVDKTIPKEPFRSVLQKLWKNPNAWGILLGRSLTDPMWWFYVFWLPQYLSDARGFSLKQIAAFAWIPFVAADIGNFTGGWISGLLIRRGMPVIRARKWICVVTCVPMLAGIPAVLVHSPFWADLSDLHCAVGLCCVVHHGADVSFGFVRPAGGWYGHGFQRIRRGDGGNGGDIGGGLYRG